MRVKLVVLLLALVIPQIAIALSASYSRREPKLKPVQPSIEIYMADGLVKCERMKDAPDGTIRVVCGCLPGGSES